MTARAHVHSPTTAPPVDPRTGVWTIHVYMAHVSQLDRVCVNRKRCMINCTCINISFVDVDDKSFLFSFLQPSLRLSVYLDRMYTIFQKIGLHV